MDPQPHPWVSQATWSSLAFGQVILGQPPNSRVCQNNLSGALELGGGGWWHPRAWPCGSRALSGPGSVQQAVGTMRLLEGPLQAGETWLEPLEGARRPDRSSCGSAAPGTGPSLPTPPRPGCADSSVPVLPTLMVATPPVAGAAGGVAWDGQDEQGCPAHTASSWPGPHSPPWPSWGNMSLRLKHSLQISRGSLLPTSGSVPGLPTLPLGHTPAVM